MTSRYPDAESLDVQRALDAASRYERRQRWGAVDREGQEEAEDRRKELLSSLARELARGVVAEAEAQGAVRSAADTLASLAQERIIGSSDLRDINYLELAVAVARSVCRIRVGGGAGTGVLVGPRLLLTNNHVLRSAEQALGAEAQFDYQENASGELLPVQAYAFEPSTFFVTDKLLDFTMVALAPTSSRGQPLERYPWTRLNPTLGKAEAGDPINIIQHPRGRLKQVALRNNKVIAMPDGKGDFVYYTTDTEPVSSGSPCFNDRWEIIALHRSGVPRMEGGTILKKDGTPWNEATDDPALVDWIANEGVSVSAIVDSLNRMPLAGPARAILDAALTGMPPNPVDLMRNEGAATRAPSDTLVNPEQMDELALILGAGDVVLVAGPALPEARGVVSVSELMRSFVRMVEGNARLKTPSRSLMAGIEKGQLDQVASALRAAQFPLDDEVRQAYEVPLYNGPYGDLARIRFASVISLAWDRQLLEAFAHRDPVELHSGSRLVLDAAKTQEFAFTWLAGDPSTEQVAIGMREVRTRLYGDETLNRYLAGLLGRSPVLFLGMTATEVVEFLDAVLPFGNSTSAGDDTALTGFAVCPIDDLWELSREQLLHKYRVQLLAYPDGHPSGLARVIRELSARSSLVGPSRSSAAPRTQPTLARIALENIGAFERIELHLNEAWNLILGNNGCGKSTILRAVALGLCGDHPQAVEAASSLLRSSATHGSIELDIGPSRFRTELTRSGTAVRVRSHSLTPLQQGSLAVLGFPALRGLSIMAASGISNPQAAEPRVEDLLPLLRGEVDRRMDDIKQWIINIDARSKDASDGRHWRYLLDRFFGVVKELTPGGTLEFDRVDSAAWEVWVRTDDGVVSIDQLSQGMSSIIAWVGSLLQRMYDIYPHSTNPAAEPAVVLIDELDAHLHPAWQRLVPSLTRIHFPNVQLLATSHSPLIAGSLRPGELFVARREAVTQADGDRLVATIHQQDLDPKGLRADQILTSPLFGMMTSRSVDFNQDVARYQQLLTADSRSPSEQREMLRLRGEIASSYRDGETAQEREQQQAPDMDELRAQLSNLGPDKRARLREFVEGSSPGSADGGLPVASSHGEDE